MIFMKISVIGDYYLRQLSLYLDICHNRSDLVLRSEIRPGYKILDRMINKTREQLDPNHIEHFKFQRVECFFIAKTKIFKFDDKIVKGLITLIFMRNRFQATLLK